jgi:DNA anti-recombination protein RmuC
VLEELIESFKNIENKYENEIKQLEDLIVERSNEFDEKFAKVQQELESRIGTIDALSLQLKRKDENLERIVQAMSQLEREAKIGGNNHKGTKAAPDYDEVRMLEKRL